VSLRTAGAVGNEQTSAVEPGSLAGDPKCLVSPNHQSYAAFQGTSNGGRQFLSNRRSNRHIVPLYGTSDRLFTRERKFAQR
jgi:hypothetical protein